MESLLNSNEIFPNNNIQKICIKINLCDYRLSTSGATTDPLILGSMLKELRNRFPNSEIYAIEGDASGRNAVSVDAFCAKLMGFNPRLISHIYKSKKSGLGDMNYEIHPLNLNLKYKDYKFNFDIFQYYILKLFKGELKL